MAECWHRLPSDLDTAPQPQRSILPFQIPASGHMLVLRNRKLFLTGWGRRRVERQLYLLGIERCSQNWAREIFRAALSLLGNISENHSTRIESNTCRHVYPQVAVDVPRYWCWCSYRRAVKSDLRGDVLYATVNAIQQIIYGSVNFMTNWLLMLDSAVCMAVSPLLLFVAINAVNSERCMVPERIPTASHMISNCLRLIFRIVSLWHSI